jgi:YD repeat-containing protein
MRSACILLSVCALFSGGCSCLISDSGLNLGPTGPVTTKEQVHQQFGQPSNTGISDGQEFEEYRTTKKVAEPIRAANISMTDTSTYGFGEVFAFPEEMYLLSTRMLFGQTLRFRYNADGKVTGVFLDDELIDHWPNK